MAIGSRAFIAAIAIAFSVVITVAVLFGEAPTIAGREGGDPLRNLIYDFQTLITGVLALLAAGWTIAQMHAIDVRQAADQRRQNYLSHRASIRAVERFVQDVGQWLAPLEEVARQYNANALVNVASGVWRREDKEVFLSVLRHVLHTRAALKSAEADAKALMTPILARNVDHFTKLADAIAEKLPDDPDGIFDFYPNSDHAPSYFDDEMAFWVVQLEVPARWLLEELARWYNGVFDEVVGSHR